MNKSEPASPLGYALMCPMCCGRHILEKHKEENEEYWLCPQHPQDKLVFARELLNPALVLEVSCG